MVETPVKLTGEQKQLFEQLANTMEKAGNKHSPNETSWIDNMKKFFEDMKP